ncbi:hypothetical protein [Pseudoxanthomonas indica]|uniref:hypothetical protein n=1 Tax=Pseudoxanthomonas indica TaxID=428993 RepID=UPI0019C10B5F|nr:hypothetical protein [Pseudoxanthomonas indica]GGD45828.1 hypothetical protein GCM10007235_17270 [Pseudoxanthomonas indica]
METHKGLEALAQALADKVKARTRNKTAPVLRLVSRAPARQFDPATRDFILRRIRFLRARYGLAWLVDQHQLSSASVEHLADHALAALLADLERGRECIADGISFDDAELVRDTSSHIIEPFTELP